MMAIKQQTNHCPKLHVYHAREVCFLGRNRSHCSDVRPVSSGFLYSRSFLFMTIAFPFFFHFFLISHFNAFLIAENKNEFDDAIFQSGRNSRLIYGRGLCQVCVGR